MCEILVEGIEERKEMGFGAKYEHVVMCLGCKLHLASALHQEESPSYQSYIYAKKENHLDKKSSAEFYPSYRFIYSSNSLST